MARRISFLSMFAAFAIILSYVESVLPISFGVPGVKLGLANFVIVLVLYYMKPSDAILINVVRILIISLLFGSVFIMLFSMAGAFLSFICMYILKRTKKFNVITISVVGGVTHNIGQIIIAGFVVSTYQIFYYLPVLIIAGIITGLIIGIVAKMVLTKVRLPKIYDD